MGIPIENEKKTYSQFVADAAQSMAVSMMEHSEREVEPVAQKIVACSKALADILWRAGYIRNG